MTDVFPQSTAHSVSCVPRLCVVLTESIIETFHYSLNLNSMCMENYVLCFMNLSVCLCASFLVHIVTATVTPMLAVCIQYHSMHFEVCYLPKYTCTLQMDPFPPQSCQTSSYKNHFLSILLLDVTKFIPLVIVLKACTL